MSRHKFARGGKKPMRPRRQVGDSEHRLREVGDSLSAETRRALSRANEQALRLESIVADAIEAIADVHVEDTPEELSHRAHRVRGAVLNALVTLADLQCAIGHIDALACIRRSSELESE